MGRTAALARAAAPATRRAAALRHQRSDTRAALVERRRKSGPAQTAVHAGVRRRFARHQLRHAHAVELAREGVPLIVIQRQLGHSNLGITSLYLAGHRQHRDHRDRPWQWKAAIRLFGCEGFEMPDWTKKNFDDLRDVSPQDARMQWRFARDALRSPELGVSRFTYEPGARMPWGHRHRVQQEAYVVVAGSGRAKLDDEVVELSVWDVLRVAPAVVRSFEAGPEGLDVICIGGRKPKGGDTERFEDFWD
jgi:mannose-6-phosphate isomerase-like protein (cupin superfamily)